MKPRFLRRFIGLIAGVVLVCGAGYQAVSARDKLREPSYPSLTSMLGSGAHQLQRFGAQRQENLKAIDCVGSLGCFVSPLMLRDSEVSPDNCTEPEIVLGDAFEKRGNAFQNSRLKTDIRVALQEATLVFRPKEEEGNLGPLAATRHNSLANVIMGVQIVGEKGNRICWPESVEFGEGQVQIRWGDFLSEDEYWRRYGSPFAGFAGSGDSNPFRCLWLGCAERSILKLEVVSDPPGQAVFLNGVQQLRTNSAFSISRKSLEKLKVGFSDRDAKPLTTCKSSQIGNRKLRFTC